MNKFLERFWFPIAALLLIAFLLGLVLFIQRQPLKHAIEIKQMASPLSDEVSLYIDGAVERPGWYSLDSEDSLEKAVRSAGIKLDEADTSKIKLHIPAINEQQRAVTQGDRDLAEAKININTASSPLLQSLPRIGPVMADRIIQYRAEKGPFQSIEELTEVRGIGKATLDKLRELITVE